MRGNQRINWKCAFRIRVIDIKETTDEDMSKLREDGLYEYKGNVHISSLWEDICEISRKWVDYKITILIINHF